MASFSRRRGLVAAAGSPVGLLLFLVVLLRSSSVHAFATPKSTARLSSTRLYVTVPPPVKEPQTNMKQTINDKSEQSDGTSQAATQNVFGSLSDAVTGSMFSLLHAFDDTPIEDSSKNLRVLWVRALLETAGRIDDPVASKLLPSKTRGLVTAPATAKLLEPVLQFTEWIQARTDFIDEGLEHFFTSPVCTNEATGKATPCNVVLIGAGYDTRALRNRHAHDHQANFFEVDLPSVVTGKRALYEKFQREHDAEWNQNDITLVGLDLNTCEDETSLVETLRQAGLNSDVPTFVVFEAVLFYVNQAAVTKIFQELSDFAANEKHAETMLCFTDSLKPFVDVPFSNQARIFFNANGMDLLEHRSRWGGAVHFCLAASRRAVSDTISESDATTTVSIKTPDKAAQFSGTIANHVGSRVGGLVNSYTPTASNNKALLTKPSFENVWYAVAYPWQIDGYDTPLDAAIGRRNKETASKPFATRLWGEPIIIYRDVKNELVAMADVCPHRSVPLSMGKLENGQVQCMYHGWTFGEKGACVDVPTLRTVDDDGNLVNNKNRDKAFLDGVTKANCGNGRAVVEHEGIVYVWRGNVLEADLSLLQSRRKGDMEAVPIDTVLDYSVDYSYIVENNLDSPHLFYLHDGSVPPIESIGMLNENLKKLRLTAFTDDCGMGHLGKLGNGRPKKLIRFDPPNIVRHGGVSGFEEEFHIIPIAPQRTRVLLRQYLPRGPILSTVTSFPFVVPLLTILVNNWNYHIGLEDACVMQGQANRIEDWGSPRMVVGGLGDDLIKRFWKWRSQAHASLAESKDGVTTPYFVDFSQNGPGTASSGLRGIPTGTSFGDDPAVVSKVRHDARLRNIPLVTDDNEVDAATGNPIGSWGIKQTYLQNTPAANFPPMNYKKYKSMLVFDTFVKGLFTQKGETCPEEKPKPPSDDDSRKKRRKTEQEEELRKPEEANPIYIPVLANQTLAA